MSQQFCTLFLLLLLCPVVPSVIAESPLREDAESFFESKVRPLLLRHCIECHGPKKQESDLRLDHRDWILQGGASGDPAAVIGDAAASMILQYAKHEVSGMEMPPDQPRLSADAISILARWIQEGLVWPDSTAPVVLTMDQKLADHKTSHWAFQPPRIVALDTADVALESAGWSQNRLDRYVLQRLAKHGMAPSPKADRRTLLRRIKYDLVGLPATMEEVVAFERDERSGAVTRLVERLLSSPQYGEHWARHWLDVARYADTRGYSFQRDRNYPWAYTFRDYVIRCFNDDLPFDQFILQQLAADQLPQAEDDNRALAGLGFLTVGRKFNQKHDDIDDKIDVVTRGFMGLTVACARCHDHKYDAIPTEDYYSLYGVFNSSTEPGALPLIGSGATLRNARDYERRFAKVEASLSDFDRDLKQRVASEAHTKIADYVAAAMLAEKATIEGLRPKLIAAWKRFLRKKSAADEPTLMPWYRLGKVEPKQFPQAARRLAEEMNTPAGEFLNPLIRRAFVATKPTTKEELAAVYGRVLRSAYDAWQKAGGDGAAREKQSVELRQLLWYFSDFNSPAQIDDAKARRYATEAELSLREQKKLAVDEFRQTQPVSYHRAMVMKDKPKPADAFVFIRGQAGRRGEAVPRQGPSLLSKSERRVFTKGSGRLQLAQEIANAQNPLTARVFVNRVWMHHFGRPLVDTPSDFGIRCEPPLQQDVLDYLAVEFMRNGWSLKWLHRKILLSATYQQASTNRPECALSDPENTLLWRANRKRLGFEATRDSLLAATRQLELTIGGAAVKQFENPEQGRRRSVYGYVDRQDLPNLLRVFDFASPDQSAAKRSTTLVPQQALFLLNSPFVLGLAEKEAGSERWNQLDADETVRRAYASVLGRLPTQRELEISKTLLSEKDRGVTKESRAKLIHVLMLTNEFVYVD